MIDLFIHATDMVEIIARAGGGGSSSGGGGGGGSGSGGGFALIAAVGYVPMHFIGKYIRRRCVNKPYWAFGQLVCWGVCILLCIVSSAYLGIIGFLIASGAIAGTGAGLYNWFAKMKRNKKAVQAIKRAALLDPAWNEEAILARARSVFVAYQKDWSLRNWKNMQAYMTPEYHHHATLMTVALQQAKRINAVDSPIIDEITIVRLYDSAVNSKDTVTVGIMANANDKLIDETTNTVIYTDTSEFTEYWTFNRQGNEWLLSGIEQATAAGWKTDISLREFARINGFYYSLDWGWLLIPTRGQLFSGASFGRSDINNHVIGVYNNTYVLQLYTYDREPQSGGSYLVAQTNVPKQYGTILVRRKSWTNFIKPKGLTKISMEWGDFNKKYDVFASSYEGATSFELLHPMFMEKLEALPFHVNIEVVDNVVYLYASQESERNSTHKYEVMLGILQEAYKQMRM